MTDPAQTLRRSVRPHSDVAIVSLGPVLTKEESGGCTGTALAVAPVAFGKQTATCRLDLVRSLGVTEQDGV